MSIFGALLLVKPATTYYNPKQKTQWQTTPNESNKLCVCSARSVIVNIYCCFAGDIVAGSSLHTNTLFAVLSGHAHAGYAHRT